MKPRLTRTTAALAGGIVVAVGAVFSIGAYLFSQHHFQRLLEEARTTARAQGEVVREALEHQMVEKDRTLIASMVERFGTQPGMNRVAILDHQGLIAFSSVEGEAGGQVTRDNPLCQSCHEVSPPQVFDTSATVTELADGSVLQVVVPIQNREACHACHDPATSINGILALDRDLAGLRLSMDRDLRSMILTSGLLSLILVGAIAGLVQMLVLSRLQRFETTARRIAHGDLERRVPVKGSDTISWLAQEFNTMADSITGLVSDVRRQRERLETVINSIDDGIVVLDPQRTILAANTAFLERTGHVRDEVMGCNCTQATGSICTTSDCPTLACLGSGERQVRICERREEDGSVIWEEVHSSPIRNAEGEIVQVVEVWRDISQRRSAEARLAESHRMASLGMLASGFSHELNTPLATVLTCVEGILREAETSTGNGDDPVMSPIKTRASVAREQVLRCRGITQHFLRLSRGQPSPGDILRVTPVVQAVVELVEPTAQARGVGISVAPIRNDPQVRVSEAELQHSLVNLLINAVEACGPQGRVEVQVETLPEEGDPDHVLIRVRDDGRGIESEKLGDIFEPFVSFRDGGTGLGLFLAQEFVQQWGGQIRVRSNLGEGSTFEIVLPALGRQESARGTT